MDFLVCICGLPGLQNYMTLEEIKDEQEAVSQVKEIALHTKVGSTIGLLSRDGGAICGWKVMEGGKLRNETIEEIQFKCGVGPDTFELAKREAEKRRKVRKDKSNYDT